MLEKAKRKPELSFPNPYSSFPHIVPKFLAKFGFSSEASPHHHRIEFQLHITYTAAATLYCKLFSQNAAKIFYNWPVPLLLIQFPIRDKRRMFILWENKCFGMSMEVKLPVFLDRPTNRRTDRLCHIETDGQIHKVASLLQNYTNLDLVQTVWIETIILSSC